MDDRRRPRGEPGRGPAAPREPDKAPPGIKPAPPAPRDLRAVVVDYLMGNESRPVPVPPPAARAPSPEPPFAPAPPPSAAPSPPVAAPPAQVAPAREPVRGGTPGPLPAAPGRVGLPNFTRGSRAPSAPITPVQVYRPDPTPLPGPLPGLTPSPTPAQPPPQAEVRSPPAEAPRVPIGASVPGLPGPEEIAARMAELRGAFVDADSFDERPTIQMPVARHDDLPAPRAARSPSEVARSAPELRPTAPSSAPITPGPIHPAATLVDARPTIQMMVAPPMEPPFSEGRPTLRERPVVTDSSSSLVVVGNQQRREIAYREIRVSDSGGSWQDLSSYVEPPAEAQPALPPPEKPPLHPGGGVDPRVEVNRPIDPRLYLWVEPSSPRAEAFRTLRNTFLARGVPRVIAVCSPEGGEGRTTTAANLALSFVEMPDRRVLLVDAHQPAAELAKIFRVRSPRDGESPSHVRRVRPYDVVQVSERLDVACIHPGGDGTVPAFDVRLFTAAIAVFLEYDYDCIIIDCGPVTGSSNTKRVVEASDAVLMVVSGGKTSRSALGRAVEEVGKDRIFGVVMNRV